MPVDTQQLVTEAEKVGQLLAQHPAIARYKDAQKAVSSDPEAPRLLSDFNKQLETLMRQEQSGMPITDSQQMQIQSLQTRIASNLKLKNMHLAEVEFYDVIRKATQALQRAAVEATGIPAGQGAGAPR